MKRKITSLKPNECIHIRTEKEARKIGKLLDKHGMRNNSMEALNFFKSTSEFLLSPLSEEKWGGMNSRLKTKYNVIPASDFIKPKSKLKKRVKALLVETNTEDELYEKIISLWKINHDAELTELPEKWCVEITDESFYDLFRWLDPACIPTKNKTFGGFVSSGKYWINAEDYGSTEGVKISFAEFKRLVLKEQPKEIDWSKPGQYVSTDDGLILMTLDGDSSGDNTFSAVVIQDNRNNYCHYDAGHKSDIWLKSNFKLHTEPITINPV